MWNWLTPGWIVAGSVTTRFLLMLTATGAVAASSACAGAVAAIADRLAAPMSTRLVATARIFVGAIDSPRFPHGLGWSEPLPSSTLHRDRHQFNDLYW